MTPSPSLTAPRFVEPDAAAVPWAAVRQVLAGLAAGTGVTFGLAVVVGATVEEAFVGHPLAPELDLLARRGAAVVLALAALLCVAWPLVAAAERAMLLGRLERRLADDPRAVALSSSVERAATAPTRIVGRLAAALGIAAATLGVVLLIVTLTGADATTLPLLGLAATTVLWLGVRVPLRRATARWDDRVDRFRQAREPWADAARTSEAELRRAAPADPGPRRRAPWSRWLGIGLAVATVAEIVAVALRFVPVVVRQGCRNCDPREFGPVGEERVDTLTIATTAFLAAATVLLVLVLAARLGDRVRQDRVVARWVTDGGPRQVPDAVAADLLGRRRAVVSLVRLLAALAPVVLAVLVTAADPEVALEAPAPGWAALLLAGALALALLDAPGGHRRRAALRQVLLPGDDAADADDGAGADDPDRTDDAAGADDVDDARAD